MNLLGVLKLLYPGAPNVFKSKTARNEAKFHAPPVPRLFMQTRFGISDTRPQNPVDIQYVSWQVSAGRFRIDITKIRWTGISMAVGEVGARGTGRHSRARDAGESVLTLSMPIAEPNHPSRRPRPRSQKK